MSRIDVSRLVQKDRVHRSVYTDADLFRLEMERLFGRAWILAGHESQAPRPGDYFTATVGLRPVTIVRAEDGALRGFHNTCPHRGARLCAGDGGSARRIQCPYHGWTFSLQGDLVSQPMREQYGSDFDPAAHGLARVARLDRYRGFVFVSLASDGPGLEDFLGHMTTSIDDLVDRAPDGEIEVLDTVIRHRYRGNWKMMFENLNDTVHAGFAHGIATQAAKREAERAGPDALSPWIGMMLANGKPLSAFNALDMVVETHGHSYFGGHIGAGYQGDAADAYFTRLAQRHGDDGARRVLGLSRHVTQIYPSGSFQARYQTVRLVVPLAVDLTEVVGYVFRLKGAPPEIEKNAMDYCIGATSAASPVIADDLDIYEGQQRLFASDGAEWISLHRANAAPAPGDDGSVRHPGASEEFIRNQFRAWAAYMAEPAA
jgi:phenylpropionate dioxygenase-like ring-hydroxylating dioxygenase large terminal subunit